jgi:hypothetical protein
VRLAERRAELAQLAFAPQKPESRGAIVGCPCHVTEI